jgi:putative transport protein
MTSTPGLGAAIDFYGTDDVGASYGAAYPFAIICMVVFAKLLAL